MESFKSTQSLVLSLALIQVGRTVVNYWRKDMHLVLVIRLGRQPRYSVFKLPDSLDMAIVVEWDVKPQIKQNKNLNC